jgi:pimeloyl-ACP methyl ester carboxylesterase
VTGPPELEGVSHREVDAAACDLPRPARLRLDRRARRPLDAETFATDTVALLDALGLDRVDLVGHDWGGFSGFLLCLRRVRGLVHSP